MKFALDQLSYSIPQSYQVLRWLEGHSFSQELNGQKEGLYLRVVHSLGKRSCFRLIPLLDGMPCDYSAQDLSMDAGGITLTSGRNSLMFTFAEPDVLTISGSGLGIRLEMMPVKYEYAAIQNDRCVLVNSSASKSQFMLNSLVGSMRVDAPYGTLCASHIYCDFLPDKSGNMQMVSHIFETVWHERSYSFKTEECMKKNREDFAAYAARFPSCMPEYKNARNEAIFILWSANVRPYRYVTRSAVLCSNNWMPGVWTWDSAIISMGLSLGDFDLAVDQLLLPFDAQTEEGLLPDYVNPNEQMWNFTKPPIHGIALSNFLIDRLDNEQLRDICGKFEKQIAYFENFTDWDHDGVYQYNHGNDCGWDNCTPFEVGAPVEGPDLNSYLILEMYSLADIYQRLDDQDSAEKWKRKGNELLQCLIGHSWDGKKFRVFQSGTHRETGYGDSLYNYLPVCLGHYLPAEIFTRLVSDLKEPGRFFTAHGLSTESLLSDRYEPDGYWRGPVWAPIMLLLVLGIADGGETGFATQLAKCFCDTCAENGFAENYNALTGEALRDPGFAWTASVFLVMLDRFLKA